MLKILRLCFFCRHMQCIMIGYHMLRTYDDTLSRCNTISERDRRTDRQIDGQSSYINIARQQCCVDAR